MSFIKNLFKYILVLYFSFEVSAVNGDWESDANSRIEQNRKRNAQITILNQNSDPVPGLTIQIEQVKHRFAFGTCIAYSPLNTNANYRNYILNHFEWAVCENESKWPANEPSRDNETYTQSDYIYNWCNTNGIKMRGHCLFWEQTSMVPSWVQSLGCSDMQTEVNERIDSAAAHFTNKFHHWDVDNEMLNNDFYGSCLGEQGRANMFIRAHQVDPNCKLFMNEYNGNSFGSYTSSAYVSRTLNLISLGAPIHGIGLQGHVNSPFNPESYWTNVLEPIRTGLGLPIWVTEYDSSTTNVTQRADDLENFYRICFSHPSVEGILMWGFWDGAQWRDNAQLVETDWTINAAGLRYEAVLNEWTTHDSNSSNIAGNVNFRGFHGTYEITISAPGQSPEVHQIELEPGTTTAQFNLLTDLHTPEPDFNAPNPNPMTWVSAPAAIDASTITMTATTANDDTLPVQYYFECTNHPEANSTWQTSPIYLAQGLYPLTSYTFKVRARDSALTPNMTEWTDEQSATTQPPGTDVQILGSWATGLTHAKENGYSRALIFIAHGELSGSNMNLASATYGGQPMTKIIELNAGTGTGYRGYVAAYILNEAGVAAATTGTFVPTWSITPESASYASLFLSNVNQTAPVGAADSNGTTTSTPNPIKSNPLAVIAGDMVIVGATCGNLGSYTLNNGFTEGTDQAIGSAGHTGVTGCKHAETAGSETPSATYSATVNRQVIVGFVIKAEPTYSPPAMPTGLTASAGNQKVVLAWNDNTEPDMAGYNVYRSTDPLIDYIKLNSSLMSESNYNDTSNVTNGILYYYIVTAVDTVFNESAASSAATATGYRLVADINGTGGDGYVDYADLYTLSDYWLNTDCAAENNCNDADFAPTNGSVDFEDFSKLAVEWLLCNNPQDSLCIQN